MELQEAIIHTRQVAEGCGVDSRDCAYQHDKLGDWLEELQAYRAIGTVEEFRTLKEAEQKRQEGCKFCNIELGDYPYIVAHTDDDSSGTMYTPAFCPICGHDLRGESYEQM